MQCQSIVDKFTYTFLDIMIFCTEMYNDHAPSFGCFFLQKAYARRAWLMQISA